MPDDMAFGVSNITRDFPDVACNCTHLALATGFPRFFARAAGSCAAPPRTPRAPRSGPNLDSRAIVEVRYIYECEYITNFKFKLQAGVVWTRDGGILCRDLAKE